MTSKEGSPNPTQEKIPFVPADHKLDPDNNEEDQAIIALSEGDLILLVHEWGLSTIEKEYNRGSMDMELYHQQWDDLLTHIAKRREQLGLEPRPMP